jgi:hypothetical protein
VLAVSAAVASFVITGLVPVIHALLLGSEEGADSRDEPGHDGSISDDLTPSR